MSTTTRGFRYPVAADTPDVPRDIGNLAQDVDDMYVSAATLGALPAAGKIGRFGYVTGTTRMYLDTGSAWVLQGSASLAETASPALTGTPTSTTAAADTNTTQIATTAYVIGQGYSKLASSPTFTGTVTSTTGLVVGSTSLASGEFSRITKTWNDNTDLPSRTGLMVDVTNQPSGANSYDDNTRGVYAQVTASDTSAAAAITGSFFGVVARPVQANYAATPRTITAMYGVYSNPTAAGGGTYGTVSTIVSYHSQPQMGATGTWTTMYGLYLANVSKSGSASCGTQYGVYIEAMTSATTNYAVYIAGTNSTSNQINWCGDTNIYRNTAGELKTDSSFTCANDMGVGIAASSNGYRFNAERSTDAVVGQFRNSKNNGGSTSVLTVSDDRGFSATNSSDIVKIIAWGDGQSGNLIAAYVQSTPTCRFKVGLDGKTYTNGGVVYSISSDVRHKENVTDIAGALETILGLRPVEFDWNEESGQEGHEIGFIAQEVEVVLPSAVTVGGDHEAEEPLLTMSQTAFIPHLVGAIQEQQKQINELRELIAA